MIFEVNLTSFTFDWREIDKCYTEFEASSLTFMLYMSSEEHKMSRGYKIATFFDKFSIWALGTNRNCWFVFGCIQGKNERESKHGNQKFAFFALENIRFQRTIYPSHMNTMIYVSFHDLVRNLVGTSMLNFDPIYWKFSSNCPKKVFMLFSKMNLRTSSACALG